MSDLQPEPYDQDDRDHRGGRHFAGTHDDEPDVDPQPQPLPDEPA